MTPDGPDPIEWRLIMICCFSAGDSLAIDYNEDHIHDPYKCRT